jgi:hypothetical protein
MHTAVVLDDQNVVLTYKLKTRAQRTQRTYTWTKKLIVLHRRMRFQSARLESYRIRLVNKYKNLFFFSKTKKKMDKKVAVPPAETKKDYEMKYGSFCVIS